MNTNDSNANGVDDRQEREFADPDVISVSLASLITNEMDPAKGDCILGVDPSVIRLWDSKTKNHLFVFTDEFTMPTDPGDRTEMLPTKRYTGQTEVWIEGLSSARTVITFSY